MHRHNILLLLASVLPIFHAVAFEMSDALVVFSPRLSGPEKKAVAMVIEEVEKRTHVRWKTSSQWPETDSPRVVLGTSSSLKDFVPTFITDFSGEPVFEAAEGYRIRVKLNKNIPEIFVIGNDARGVLFGVGRLLRAFHMETGRVKLDDDFNLTTAPKYPLRGHQLGYRPKTNSYDAWDLDVWEQYFRDLVVFGCNSIELIPPRSDDADTSPLFPRPPMEMMVGMSRLADDYGLGVWIWYPALDTDYSSPAMVEFALKEWGEVFKQLPRIDAVFVPGGDPGHTPPKHLMGLLQKQAQNLHRFHPRAQVWVSPQGFNEQWFAEFLGILRNEEPTWLSGVVYGPQVRGSMAQLRASLPPHYPLRNYPDITHSRQCQFPVPDWDTAFAVTEARECINPRPLDQAAIFQHTQPGTVGFITYSEGCNDDVNKAVWSALGWDPDAPIIDALREYSRYFIGDRYTDDFAQGLLALERNWRGPLLANDGVESTLLQFQTMERLAATETMKNWRFQQALFRAYYDAYTRRRLIHETDLENRAMDQLLDARKLGALAAMDSAEKILESANEPIAPDCRRRIFDLAEALFQSIRAQLSVPKYQAISADRGAMLDTLDHPLNNSLWLKERFATLRKVSQEEDRLKGIDEIANWTNAGPGGFYDDLGNVACQPHLLHGLEYEKDPGFLTSPRVGFQEDVLRRQPNSRQVQARRFSWINHAESLFDAPLMLRYTNLDPNSRYRLRVVYAGDAPTKKIRLVANDTFEIHPFIEKPVPFERLEFEIPESATRKGDLILSWTREPGQGGNGRGCQVSEVWLMKR